MTSTPTRPVDNVVIATKGLQDSNINIIAGTTVENKGKLILTFIRNSVLMLDLSVRYYPVKIRDNIFLSPHFILYPVHSK